MTTGREPLADRQYVVRTQTLIEAAGVRVDDHDVVGPLLRASVEVLGATAAGLLLVDQRGQLQVAASSSEEARLLELVRLERGEGPGLDCVHHGAKVTVCDLGPMGQRWPQLVAGASRVGFGTLCAVPMQFHGQVIGGLDLFQRPGHAFATREVLLAQALADIATIGVLQRRSAQRTAVLAEQLRGALVSRSVIEQAKGELAQFGAIDVDAAHRALRQYARDHNLKLSALADAVVKGECPLTAVLLSAVGPRTRPRRRRSGPRAQDRAPTQSEG
jgi:GAF domain-containing protein